MTNVFKEKVLQYGNAIETRWHDKTNEIYPISFRIHENYVVLLLRLFCSLVEKASRDTRSIWILSAPFIVLRSIILFALRKAPSAVALIAQPSQRPNIIRIYVYIYICTKGTCTLRSMALSRDHGVALVPECTSGGNPRSLPGTGDAPLCR